MLLPKFLLYKFLAFLECYMGVSVIYHDEPKRGEHARFWCNNTIYFIREPNENEGENLEVWNSDPDMRQLLENSWTTYFLATEINEDDEDDED